MKKFYSFIKSHALLPLFVFLLLTNTSAFSQQCGQVVETFDNTSGSTAGFTGDLALGLNGSDGYLTKTRVVGGAIYSVTTPTYQLPAAGNTIGLGFSLSGTVRVKEIEIRIFYKSTLSDEIVTFALGRFIPTYQQGSTTYEFCQSFSTASIPGFPPGGQYRLQIELTTETGGGTAGENIIFDDFRTTGTMSQAPLPVTFVSLDAKKLGGNILLTWKIAGEENVVRYEVERSDDGRSFTTIASLDRHGKDTYTYSDATARSFVYYRIRNVDNDGKFKYSAIARVANGQSSIVLKAFPQPAINQLTIQHPSINGRAVISVSSADGRVVRTVFPDNGSIQTYINMSALQKGLYVIRFDDGDGKVEILKVLKQ